MGRPRTVDPSLIIAAAARVFERAGYADSTLEAIAAEAGVSKPTIYQYFPSKQSLIEIIVEKAIYPLSDGVSEIVHGDGDAATKIFAFVDLHVTAACQYTVYYQVILADRHQLSQAARRRYQDWALAIDRDTEELLRQGVAESIIRPDIDPKLTVKLINSTLTSIARWYRPEHGHNPQSIQTAVLQLWQGIATLPLSVSTLSFGRNFISHKA